jgi:hypothetical protein
MGVMYHGHLSFRHLSFCNGRDVPRPFFSLPVNSSFCFRGRRSRAAKSKCRLAKFWNTILPPMSASAPLEDTHSHQEEEAPETTAPSHTFTTKQLRHAVTAANLFTKKLKDQEEAVRRLVLSSELKERKRNPLGVHGPTPEQQKEAWQKELAERARKASEQERWEQCKKKSKADEAFAMELRIALNQRRDEERIRALRSMNNQPISQKEKARRKECVERARTLATAQGSTKATFADFSAFYHEGPRSAAPGTATSTSNKALPTASSISCRNGPA